jgi:hypothetical protein
MNKGAATAVMRGRGGSCASNLTLSGVFPGLIRKLLDMR